MWSIDRFDKGRRGNHRSALGQAVTKEPQLRDLQAEYELISPTDARAPHFLK